MWCPKQTMNLNSMVHSPYQQHGTFSLSTSFDIKTIEESNHSLHIEAEWLISYCNERLVQQVIRGLCGDGSLHLQVSTADSSLVSDLFVFYRTFWDQAK